MRKNTQLLLPLLLLFFFFPIVRASAADWDPVTDADKTMTANSLDPGAGALVLFKRGRIDVTRVNTSLWLTRITTYTRIKILTDAGRDAANVSIEAPKYLRVTKIEGRTILPTGETIPLDTSKVFHGVAFKEGRDFAVLTTSFAFPSATPGAIIEYQSEQTEDWFFPPPWVFDTEGLATLSSTLTTVVTPTLGMAQLPMSTTANQIAIGQKQTSQGSQTDFTVQNLRPVRREPYSVPYLDRTVMVLFTPAEIVLSGQVIPIIKRWDDVAEEVNRMYTNAQKSDKQASTQARMLTEKLPDPRVRAEAIYKYLQQNITSTNVVGIGLGRSIDDVLSSKRADPDDVNALFLTMLKEAKIDSDFVLVATQNWQTLTKEFPNFSQLSRLIVRINLKDGPVFADAASASAPFGDLPWFEKGITGLVVKGNKIQEAPIPLGSLDDNTSASKYTLQIDNDGKIEGDAEVNLKGVDAMELKNDLIGEQNSKVQEVLTRYLSEGRGATVSNLAVPELQDSSQPLVLKARLQEADTDPAGPGEILVNPWMSDPRRTPRFTSVQRRSFVLFHGPKKDVTTSTLALPLGIKVEKLPEAVSLQSDLADFSHSCTQNESTVTCTRTFILKKNTISDPNGYPAIKKFFDEVAQHDQDVILLRKQ